MNEFFDILGDERAAQLTFVTCDGAEWIRTVVAERAPAATVCLDPLPRDRLGHRRPRRGAPGRVERASSLRRRPLNQGLKGLRFLLLRNWENLTGRQRSVIRELDAVNRRLLRARQLKEELSEIFKLPILAARPALDDWLAYASRSRLAPFVKLARTIRSYRASIEATIEWRTTNGIAESNNAAIGRLRTNAPRLPRR